MMSCNPLLPNNIKPIRLGAANRLSVNGSLDLDHPFIAMLGPAIGDRLWVPHRLKPSTNNGLKCPQMGVKID